MVRKEWDKDERTGWEGRTTKYVSIVTIKVRTTELSHTHVHTDECDKWRETREGRRWERVGQGKSGTL